MPRVVKNDGVNIRVAHTAVYAPGYTIIVANTNAQTALPDGWMYYANDVESTDFVPNWVQPTDATNTYKMGDVVAHNGSNWQSVTNVNVWEPGVACWVPYTNSLTPPWVQPVGSTGAYTKDAIVSHNGNVWISLVDNNVWEPGIANWRQTFITAPGAPPQYPAWVQPTGAQDAYALNAIVTHNGHTWQSLYAANVWEPGVFGWTMLS